MARRVGKGIDERSEGIQGGRHHRSTPGARPETAQSWASGSAT